MVRIGSGNDVFDEQCVDSSPDTVPVMSGWQFSILTKREYIQVPRTEYAFFDSGGEQSGAHVKSIQRFQNQPGVARVTFYTLILNPQ